MARRLQQGIQSIEVGHELLVVLAASPRPLALKELARRARMSAPKAHRYLVSYTRLGLVGQEPDTGRYGLWGSSHCGLGSPPWGAWTP